MRARRRKNHGIPARRPRGGPAGRARDALGGGRTSRWSARRAPPPTPWSRIPATRPDVAVLDVRLPDGSGVEVCREIRSQDEDIKCLMLTSFADDEALFDAIMAGASGYVLKAIRGNELLTAVRDVAAGKSLLDPVPPRACWSGCATARPPKGDDRLAAPHRPGAQDPRPDRRGPDQPGHRRAAAPRREDDQELRLQPAGQARHGAPLPGRRLCGADAGGTPLNSRSRKRAGGRRPPTPVGTRPTRHRPADAGPVHEAGAQPERWAAACGWGQVLARVRRRKASWTAGA